MSIFHDYLAQHSLLITEGKVPRVVIFNRAGFDIARAENDANGTRFSLPPVSARQRFYSGLPYKFYCGLPYLQDPRQEDAIVVSDEEPQVAAERINNLSHRKPVSITLKANMGKFTTEPTTMVEIVAASLNKASLCNLIQKWTDAHPNSDFAVALNDAVRNHGRFE